MGSKSPFITASMLKFFLARQAVVSHAVLREVIGADALVAHAAADLRAALARDRTLHALALSLVELAREHRHTLGAVLELGALLLTRNNDARRLMDEAHGRARLVDVLATCTGSAVDLHFDILGPEVDVDLLHLRQHRDRRGRGVHAPAGFGLRHALDAVDAGFELEARVRAIAADDKVSFLNTAQLRIVVVEQLHAVPPLFRVHRIHAVEVCGKKRALLPAHAAANFNDDVFVVVRVARQEQHAQLVKKALFFRLGYVQFLLRYVLELGIGYKLQRLRDVVLALLVRAVGLYHGRELLLLARERAQLLWVSVNFRHFEQLADLVIAARELFELFPHQTLSSAMKSEQALTNWSRQKW